MPAARQRQRVDDPVESSGGVAEPGELGVEEADVEAGIVDDEPGVADEAEELVGDRGEGGLSARNSAVRPCTAKASCGIVALGIDVAVEGRPVGMWLTSSTQPISTMRCRRPGRGRWSRCRRRSRASLVSAVRRSAARPGQARQEPASDDQSRPARSRRVEAAAGVDDEVGASPLLARPASAAPGSPRSCSRVMPGRASTRARCTSRGRGDDQRPRRSAARRRSRTGAGCRARRAARAAARAAQEARRSASRTSGCTIASSRAQRRRHRRARARRAARGRPRRPRRYAGKAASTGATAAPPAIERDAPPRRRRAPARRGAAEHRRGRRLAHADRAGEAEDEGHRAGSPLDVGDRRGRAAPASPRAHAEPALEARHGLVQQHAEPVDGREAARARAAASSGVSSGT